MEELLEAVSEDDVCVVEAAVLLVELVVLVCFGALPLNGLLRLAMLAGLGSGFLHWCGGVWVVYEYWFESEEKEVVCLLKI